MIPMKLNPFISWGKVGFEKGGRIAEFKAYKNWMNTSVGIIRYIFVYKCVF